MGVLNVQRCKICYYDWNFMWKNPTFDKYINELLLQKM